MADLAVVADAVGDARAAAQFYGALGLDVRTPGA
jgi:hypothetical protein